MKIRKIFAIVMTVILLVSASSVWMYSYAKEKEVDANILLLESLLENRYWVVESLVFDKTDNNPYTELVDYATEESFMEEVITNYTENDAFRVLVDCLEMGDNASTYVQNLGQETIVILLNTFGLVDDESLIDYIDNHVKSVEDLQYEAIINAVLSKDYTSSWGSTLFEADAELERYRQSAELLSGLSDFQNACVASSELLSAGYFESAEDFTDYVDNFLPAFEDNLYNMLVSIPGCEGISDYENWAKKIIGVSSSVFSIDAMAYNPLKSLEEGSQEHSEWLMSADYSTYLAPQIDFLLKGYGKTLELRSLAVEYAMLFETLMAQKETTVQVLERIKQTTDDTDLANTINVYMDMVNDQGNDQALAYDAIINHLEKQDTIGTSVIKGGHKLFDNFLTKRIGYYDASNNVMTNGISQNLIKLGKCIELGVWVADKATNIKDTAKKIHICKYINNIINSATDTFLDDLIVYKADKTDENAKKCLDDLEFIKKLRLYGETQAYGSVCSQTESFMGLLLGNSKLQEDIDKKYQGNIDAILGCTVYPTSSYEFSVDEGETLELYVWNLSNDAKTIYAVLRDEENHSIMSFPEADVILMGALKLNGGTIKLIGNNELSEKIQMFMPTLTVTQESNIEIINGDGAKIAFGSVENNSTLNISLDNANATFDIIEELKNTGTINVSSQNGEINLYDVDNSGTISLETTTANIYGNLTNNGSFTGAVNICGNGTKTFEDGYYERGIQTLSGAGTYTNLYFNSNVKEGVKISGEQTVTEYLVCNSTRLRTSENLFVTGNCKIADNYFKNSLSFRNYLTTEPLTIGGTANIYGNVTFGGITTFNDGLNITNECETLMLNGETIVKGDTEYDGGTIKGSDWLKLHGDLNITVDTPSISKLDFVGLLPQTVNSSNSLTVSQLNNQNVSLSGVDFTSKIYVTDTLQSSSTSAYTNGKNIVLTGMAKLNGNTINGSISAENWTCADSATVKGNIFATGDIVVGDEVTLNAIGYQQSSGKLTIAETGNISCKGDLLLGGTTTNNGTILVDGDAKITSDYTGGTLTIKGDMISSGNFSGGTLNIKGDVSASATFAPDFLNFNSKVAQRFYNSSTTTVKKLHIDNSSLTGFTVDSIINVEEEYVNNTRNLINSHNIRLADGATYIDGDNSHGDFTISGDYTIKSGETLTINGGLTLLEGATLTVEEGATLNVKQNVTSNGATIIVNEGATMNVADYLKSTSDTLDVYGNLIVGGDAKITSSTVNATGIITFKGDLTVSGGTWNNPNVVFISKLPQVVSGRDINVNDITIDNTSKSGITFTLTYTASGKVNILHLSADNTGEETTEPEEPTTSGTGCDA